MTDPAPGQAVTIVLLIGQFEKSSEKIFLTDQSILANEYARESTSESLILSFNKAGFENVLLLQVTLGNFDTLLNQVRSLYPDDSCIYFNLCDGLETDGYPGISVVRSLERREVLFTGSSSAYFATTISKLRMKECFSASNVPTSPYIEVDIETNCIFLFYMQHDLQIFALC